MGVLSDAKRTRKPLLQRLFNRWHTARQEPAIAGARSNGDASRVGRTIPLRWAKAGEHVVCGVRAAAGVVCAARTLLYINAALISSVAQGLGISPHPLPVVTDQRPHPTEMLKPVVLNC